MNLKLIIMAETPKMIPFALGVGLKNVSKPSGYIISTLVRDKAKQVKVTKKLVHHILS